MQRISLIGLDLDGTVFTDDKRVTDETKKAIEEAQEEGAEIVFATGRPFHGVPEAICRMEGVRYIITSNGALTFDLQKNKPLHGNFLDIDFAEKAVSWIEKHGLLYSFFTDGYGYADESTYERLLSRYQKSYLLEYMKHSRKPVKSTAQRLEQAKETGSGIENIWLLAENGRQRDEIADYFKDSGASLIRNAERDLEMVSPKANKGVELLRIAARGHIPAEEIMAVGDNENDVSMLKVAGISFAMGNGTQEAKDAAQFVTEDNEHDGVAEAIYRVLR